MGMADNLLFKHKTRSYKYKNDREHAIAENLFVNNINETLNLVLFVGF